MVAGTGRKLAAGYIACEIRASKLHLLNCRTLREDVVVMVCQGIVGIANDLISSPSLV